MSANTESAILSAIEACRRRIALAEDALTKAIRDRDNLDEFSSRFSARTEAIMSDLTGRQDRLSNAGVDERQVRVFATYKSAMQEALDQARRHADKLHSQQQSIRVAVEQAEDKVHKLRADIRAEQDELARLNAQLQAARAAAIAGL